MLTRVRKPDPPTYPHADHPLTAAEARERYGDLLDRFYPALQEDGHLVADIAEAILTNLMKRERVLERVARDRQAKASAASPR